jgi:hypothetical protein
MKKIISYLVSIPLVGFALVPSIKFYIPMPTENLWYWYILLAGFFGILVLFIQTNIFIKVVSIGGFINCFFSSCPYISFTSYLSLIFCVYFYILCSKIHNWLPILKSLQAVFILIALLMFMQFIGKDSLLNFGTERIRTFGTIGQHMQTASLVIVLSSILIQYNLYNFALAFFMILFTHSIWSLFSLTVGLFFIPYAINKKISVCICAALIGFLIFFAFLNKKINPNIANNGRLGVWSKTISLSNEHPFTGWGIGTYKEVFPAIAKVKSFPWKTTHNFLIQILFETGYIGLFFITGTLAFLFYRLFKAKEYICISGLSMLITDNLVHFADRMWQAVLIIIVFLVFCEQRSKKKCLL